MCMCMCNFPPIPVLFAATLTFFWDEASSTTSSSLLGNFGSFLQDCRGVVQVEHLLPEIVDFRRVLLDAVHHLGGE